MDKIKLSSNRSFGILFFVLFLIIALYPLINNDDFGILILIIFSKTMDASNACTRLLVSDEREMKFLWLKISF